MHRKINKNDILRLVYESYKHIVNEGGNFKKNLKELHPEFNLTVENGEYIFSMLFRDKEAIDTLGNFQNFMVVRASERAAKNKMPYTDVEENDTRNVFRKPVNVYDKSKTPEGVYVKLRLENPYTILTDDGKHTNNDSIDVEHLSSFYRGIDDCLLRAGCKMSNYDKAAAVKSIYATINNQISKDDNDKLEVEVRSLFFEICKKLGDDETRKLIRTIQIEGDDIISDHMLSLHNKLRILAQGLRYGETPTYLATEKQWLALNRRVVDFSKPYYSVTMNGGRMSDKDIEKYLSAAGKAMAKTKDGGVGTATRRAGEVATNVNNGRKSFSYNSPYYNVTATEVISNMNDKWVTEPAMSNNLNGDLNDAALKSIGLDTNIDDDGRTERTKKLNDIFNTGNYNSVDLTYNAVCRAARVNPTLTKDNTPKEKIKEATKILQELLISKLNSFNKGDGHIALAKNFTPLVNVGLVILQAEIGLPMDAAPAIEWAQEHEQIFNTLSGIVFAIANNVAYEKREIKKEMKDAMNMNEMIDLYSPLIIHEEWFNNTLKLIKENVEI